MGVSARTNFRRPSGGGLREALGQTPDDARGGTVLVVLWLIHDWDVSAGDFPDLIRAAPPPSERRGQLRGADRLEAGIGFSQAGPYESWGGGKNRRVQMMTFDEILRSGQREDRRGFFSPPHWADSARGDRHAAGIIERGRRGVPPVARYHKYAKGSSRPAERGECL